MEKKKYKIRGMSCAACVTRVERAVKGVSGVEACEVNLLLGSLNVTGDIDPKRITDAVHNAGYEAELDDKENAADNSDEGQYVKQAIIRLAVSFVLLICLMYISMGHSMLGWP